MNWRDIPRASAYSAFVRAPWRDLINVAASVAVKYLCFSMPSEYAGVRIKSMKFVYSIEEAKKFMSSMVNQAMEGHEVIIKKGFRGKGKWVFKPVIRLIPYTENPEDGSVDKV